MSVTIGNGVTSIDDSAFRGCVGLKEMRFTGTVSQWKTMLKGSDWNKGVSASCLVKLSAPTTRFRYKIRPIGEHYLQNLLQQKIKYN